MNATKNSSWRTNSRKFPPSNQSAGLFRIVKCVLLIGFLFYLLSDRIENLEAFVKDLEAGNLEPYLKSEPIPTDNSGPVTVAVAKNFEDTITNNGKDTLIEFYAPWYVDSATISS